MYFYTGIITKIWHYNAIMEYPIEFGHQNDVTAIFENYLNIKNIFKTST